MGCLASRYPVRIRIESNATEAFRIGESAVAVRLLKDVDAALRGIEREEQPGSPAVTLCREIAKTLESLWRALGAGAAEPMMAQVRAAATS